MRVELVLGSQNFTNNGRNAKEASVSVQYRRENRNYDDFLKSIDRWWQDATPISSESLEKLLNNLQYLENLLEEQRSSVDEIFKNFHDDCNVCNVIKIVDRTSSIDEKIKGRVKPKQFKSGSRKIIEITSERKLGEPLNRLTFYPVFIRQTNRLTYARIGKTIISFITNDVYRNNEENIVCYEGIRYYPKVTFVSDNDFNINIKLVSVCEDNILEFRFNFNGEALEAENSVVQNRLREKLEDIIFHCFDFKSPFLEACEEPGDIFNLYPFNDRDLNISVQTTCKNHQILTCSS